MFNVQKLLFQDMESILARLYGASQAWLQYVHCQTQKSDYFSSENTFHCWLYTLYIMCL